MGLLDFVFGEPFPNAGYRRFDVHSPEEFISFFKREERDKVINFLVGCMVVKVHIIATKDSDLEFGLIMCKVLEIDGVAVSEQEQTEKMGRLQLDSALIEEELKILLLDVLGKFNIIGNPIVVTDDYVSGHLRVVRLRERLKEGGAQ